MNTVSSELLPQRALGSTGLYVSCLGLGTVKFGRNRGVKYPHGFALPDDKQIQCLLSKARELGINLLDTAPAYGSSEERLGKLLGNRHEWILCSKTGEEFRHGNSFFDFSAAHTRNSVERSLKRLRTDYLDLVLVHSDGNDEHIIRDTDCFGTLARCKEQGLIRAYGMSGKTVAGGKLALQHSDVVMVTCNPLEIGELPVIAEAHRLGKGVLIKKAFNSGQALVWQDDNPQIAADTALSFVFSQPGVSSVIIGTLNEKHLRQNVASVNKLLIPG
jgi:aryl-alcohol dehydrogenase-like predicted oxidoreductase